MTISFKGSWDLSGVEARLRDAALAGLEMGLEHIHQIASDLAPNDEGTLSRSGRVTVDPAGLTGGVTFDTVYARRQHEELTWRHPGGKTAKYLEKPMTSEADVVADIIAAQCRRALR